MVDFVYMKLFMKNRRVISVLMMPMGGLIEATVISNKVRI